MIYVSCLIIVILKGQAINFIPLSKSPHYPLVTGEAVKTTTADLAEARYVSMQNHNNKLT